MKTTRRSSELSCPSCARFCDRIVPGHASPDYYTQRLGAIRILAEALTSRN